MDRGQEAVLEYCDGAIVGTHANKQEEENLLPGRVAIFSTPEIALSTSLEKPTCGNYVY